MTVMTGKSMSGSSSCLRLPQAEMPGDEEGEGQEQRDAALADGELR